MHHSTHNTHADTQYTYCTNNYEDTEDNHTHTTDLFITDKKYSELRSKDDSSLAIKDLVSMRVYEVVRPLRDQIEAAKADKRFLTESKAALIEEVKQIKDRLGQREKDIQRLLKTSQDWETKCKNAEERVKVKEFKKVR